jgi:hypothetical protein
MTTIPSTGNSPKAPDNRARSISQIPCEGGELAWDVRTGHDTSQPGRRIRAFLAGMETARFPQVRALRSFAKKHEAIPALTRRVHLNA